jgi:hypothetical protein
LNQYAGRLSSLASDIRRARTEVKKSEDAESQQDAINQRITEARGLPYVQSFLKDTLSSTEGKFNDENLAQTIERWHAEAVKAAGAAAGDGTPNDVLLDALHAHGQSLVKTRDELRETYLVPPTVWRDCQSISQYPVRLVLRIKRKALPGTAKRDTGDSLVVLSITPTQPRPIIEVVPTILTIYSPNVPEFAVRDGVVQRTDGASFRARVGTLLLANVARWGADESSNLGIGAGVGFLGDQKTVADFIPLAAVISIRDFLRIGTGAGWAEQPFRLKAPAREGQPLPANTPSLDELVETKRRFAWFATLTLSGLSLKVR